LKHESAATTCYVRRRRDASGQGLSSDGLGQRGVELVRFDLEHFADKELARFKSIRQACRAIAPESKTLRRLRLANSLLLTKAVAPRLYALADQAQGALGVHVDFELYQSRGSQRDEVNACVGVREKPLRIELLGAVVTHLDDDSILAVIGHELGHYLAHGPHSPLKLNPYLAYLARESVKGSKRLRVRRLALAFSQAAELTADRFGLLACRNLEAALRLELVSVTGVPARALDADVYAYLDQCRALMDQALARDETAVGTSHPEHSLRAYALWLFSETAEYKQLTGHGTGTRTLREIDGMLRKLVLPPLPPVTSMKGKRRKVARKPASGGAPASAQQPSPVVASPGSIRTIVNDVADYCGGGLKGLAGEVRTLVGTDDGTGRRSTLLAKMRALLESGGPSGVEIDRGLLELDDDDLERQFEALEERARKGQLAQSIEQARC
jgi:hypothetical protein